MWRIRLQIKVQRATHPTNRSPNILLAIRCWRKLVPSGAPQYARDCAALVRQFLRFNSDNMSGIELAPEVDNCLEVELKSEHCRLVGRRPIRSDEGVRRLYTCFKKKPAIQRAFSPVYPVDNVLIPTHALKSSARHRWPR